MDDEKKGSSGQDIVFEVILKKGGVNPTPSGPRPNKPPPGQGVPNKPLVLPVTPVTPETPKV